MGSLTTPLNSLLRFGRAFRASKSGIKPAEYRGIIRPDPKRGLFFANHPLKFTPAERYGGILGKGYRREPYQYGLFSHQTGRYLKPGVAETTLRTSSGTAFPAIGTPRALDRAKRYLARVELKKAVAGDIAKIPVVDAFLKGSRRRSLGWQTSEPITAANRHTFAYKVGRLFRRGMQLKEKLAPFKTLPRDIGARISESYLVQGYRSGRRGMRSFATHQRPLYLLGERIGLGSRSPSRRVRRIGRGIAAGAENAASAVSGVYDSAARSVNTALAKRFPTRTKIKVQERSFGGLPVIHDAQWREAVGAGGEHPSYGVIREFTVKGNRIPMGGADITTREYGRHALISPIASMEHPGAPQFAIHPNAGMKERISNLRNTFEQLRKAQPGVHDWYIRKAVPQSRSLRELEHMVGAEGAPTMKLRRLRYTRPPRQR